MEVVRLMLAAAGVLALVLGTLRAALRLLGQAAEGLVAEEVERARARRGDLTGAAEARSGARRARHGRVKHAVELALWTALLAGPAFTPWPLALYAGLSAVWLVHWLREHHG